MNSKFNVIYSRSRKLLYISGGASVSAYKHTRHILSSKEREKYDSIFDNNRCVIMVSNVLLLFPKSLRKCVIDHEVGHLALGHLSKQHKKNNEIEADRYSADINGRYKMIMTLLLVFTLSTFNECGLYSLKLPKNSIIRPFLIFVRILSLLKLPLNIYKKRDRLIALLK